MILQAVVTLLLDDLAARMILSKHFVVHDRIMYVSHVTSIVQSNVFRKGSWVTWRTARFLRKNKVGKAKM